MKLLKWLFLLTLLAGILVLAGAAFLWRQLHEPYRAFGEDPVFVEVERGMSTRQIGALLERNGVLRNGWLLQIARLTERRAALQAGEYRFADAASALDVFSRLRRGDVYYVTLSIPEGKNLWEIAQIIEQVDLPNAKGFLEEAKKPGLIQDLAPQAISLEGYLFPSTYQFRRKTTARQVCERLTAEFRRQWQTLNTQAQPHQIVTMASLIEKETSIADERALVSSVFWNRLRDGIRLDCDPTVIYAALLEGKYRGTIYLSDLRRDHPYNTYQRTGLPPGPIANPGLESLRAALKPANTHYLFFVAKGDGTGAHRFSESLADHERNVKAYREAVKSRAANGVATQ